MVRQRLAGAALGALATAVLVLAAVRLADAQGTRSFQVIYTFGASGDGVGPSSGIILDEQGNAYGETIGGGSPSCPSGCGLVYELSPQKDGDWVEAILYEFTGGSDGYNPNGGLAVDGAGNLYGVAQSGGAHNRGTVFELSPSGGVWTETTLYNFCSQRNCEDGGVPFYGPVLDSSGNLYGTAGGSGGVAYELSPGASGWTETVLYTFCSQPNCSDGNFPHGLVRDNAGNLYGPALDGGPNNAGLIFSLRPKPGGGWGYVALYDFGGRRPGDGPSAVDLHDGGLYGDTVDTVFELTANGRKVQEQNVRTFTIGSEGLEPEGSLAFDGAGDLYGATAEGGNGCVGGCGVVFEMTPGTGGKWQYQVLHAFDNQDGNLPQYGVVIDDKGNLYGTTLGGGAPYYGGVVFEITP